MPTISFNQLPKPPSGSLGPFGSNKRSDSNKIRSRIVVDLRKESVLEDLLNQVGFACRQQPARQDRIASTSLS